MNEFIHLYVPFEWLDRCESIFQKLKEYVIHDPFFILPLEGEGSTVYFDTFGVGSCCVLMQRRRVIAYAPSQLEKTLLELVTIS